MAKAFAKWFYNSKSWKCCRQDYISKRTLIDGGLCEDCKEEQGFLLHHKKALSPENIHNPKISLNHENLQWVCKDCHDRQEGHFNSKNKKEVVTCAFDIHGQLIPKPR